MQRPGPRNRILNRDLRNPKVSTPVSSWLNFTPLSLSPALWLDAADTSTITESGGLVSQWDDKSGNGRNVVQATGANQPTTGTNTQNGLNVITFDGARRLKTAAETTNSVATVFGVGNHTSTGVGGRFLTGFSGIGYQNNGPYPFPGFQNAEIFAGTAAVTGPALSVAANKYYFITWRLNGASSQVFVQGKGGTVGNPGSNPASLATVGARGDNTLGFVGHIAEIIVVFSAVDENTRIVVENYLQNKWEVQP
jgi:hypothetical protein